MDVLFYITPAAHDAILEAIQVRGHGMGIRICFLESGEGTLKMGIEFADTMSETECCLQADGFDVLVAQDRLPRLHNMHLDFRSEAGHSGFHLAPLAGCVDCSCGQASSEGTE